EYWYLAGQKSSEKAAFAEAIAQVKRGLQLLAGLPPTNERKRVELDLQVTLAEALRWERGHAHPEIGPVLGRARELILETGAAATDRHFSVLAGLALANYWGGRPRAALEQANDFLSLAESQGASEQLLKGHALVGQVRIIIGNYPAALWHLQRVAASPAPQA